MKDKSLNKDQFLDFYSFLGGKIESDKEFKQILIDSWKLDELQEAYKVDGQFYKKDDGFIFWF